jgi:hypothetical protein
MQNSEFRRVRRAAQVLFAAFLAFCVVPVATAQGPSLAELAKKEQERRKTQKPTGKTYTNKDLPESAQGRTPTPSSSPTPAPTPINEAKPAEKPAGQDEKDEGWWRKRIAAAREELRRNEVFAEALQTRINSLSSDFVNRDDPYQRAKVGEDRDKAMAELARVKAEIETGKKQIEDIEEEARKAGVPPGWLR